MGKTLSVQIRTQRLPLSGAAVASLRHLRHYNWIIFTSKNAADYFARELAERNIALPQALSIAAVGPITARALRTSGLRTHLIPDQHTALDLAKALGTVRGQRIFFPCSAIAPMGAVKLLRRQGAHVRTVPLYTTTAKTLTAKERQSLDSGTYTEIAFTSPSGIKGFLGQLTVKQRQQTLKLRARCIGPTTARAAKEAGFKKILARGML